MNREIMPQYLISDRARSIAKEFIHYVIENPFEMKWYRVCNMEKVMFDFPYKVYAECPTRKRILKLDSGTHSVCHSRYLNLSSRSVVSDEIENIARDWGTDGGLPASRWIEREIIKTVRQMKVH